MKIVEIIHALNPGGAERLLVDLSNRFAEEPHIDIYVVVLKNRAERNESFYLSELSPNITYIPLDFQDGFHVSYPFKIKRLINKIKPDIVHIHCVFQYLVPAILLGKKTKYVLTLHNEAEKGLPGIQKRMAAVLVKMGKLQIVTISHTNQLSLRRYLQANNDILIYNGRKLPVRSSQFIEVKEYFDTLRTNANTRILLVIAKCSEQKNLSLLINTVNKLNEEKGNDLKLLVIGDGYTKSELGKRLLLMASETILFLGPKNNVADYFYLCDAFCLSSLYEGMPITLIEAMACGCIVVSTPVSGVIDILEDGKTGFIAADFTLTAYRDALERYLIAEEQIDREWIQSIFKESYSIDKCAANYLKLFNQK